MDISAAQAKLDAARIDANRDRSSEIAEEQRQRQQDLRRQEEVAEASRAPEKAAGQIVDEAV
ncbi:MAG: hypothetical protein EA399_06810 [Desulfovibrionales bacterium]|nr:MAG: hypothetical protein EA399_06810 [Desulfovibrionales bacterium]